MDYGAGNLPSVERALLRLGADVARCRLSAQIEHADAVVLPGVGHFGALVRSLDARGLRATLADAIGSGVPFLGICLGMQALYESSDEAPGELGLGVLSGVVRSLADAPKLPHMGWNTVSGGGRLLRGVSGAHFYFAHSFAAPPDGAAGICRYGASFAAVAERDRVMGVQFHPEKSGAVGAAVLRNFLSVAA